MYGLRCQKELSIYKNQKYSIAFLNVLGRFLNSGTIEYSFIQLCKTYLYVYGKLV